MSSVSGRSKRALGVLFGALTLAAVSTGTASASWDSEVAYSTWPYEYNASSQFVAAGDHFYISDDEADGFAAVGRIYVGYDGVLDTIYNSLGYGSLVDANYDFTENKAVSIKACIGHASTDSYYYCSNWTSAES